MKVVNVDGLKFNRLTVVKRIKGGIECVCDCGNNVLTNYYALRSGNTKSYGCLHKELVGTWTTKHGYSKHPLYKTWHNMRSRCKNPNATKYEIYGGAGISVCNDWDNNFVSFYNWSIENGWEKGLSIDRIDGKKGYCPSNCRWVDDKTQNNNLRSNHLITYNGKTLSVYAWADELKLNKKTLSERLRRGWSIERAFTTGGDSK
jgi:hypothetical protein